jgi:signal transduction histidine kinase
LHREQTARAELEKIRSELEAARRQREEFISMIAHDLATPLTTVAGYAELLGRGSVHEDVRERARTTIVAETRRMARLVEDLADAANLAVGRFQIQLVPCDLAELAREQVELARARTDRHTIRLEAPASVPARCDRDRMAQILSNLLANAINHTEGGDIRVRLRVEGDQALLNVQDEGPGIPPDCLETIFEPHRRLPSDTPEGRPRGAGLGLHITRGIVEGHGGRIWVESTPGRGAAFNVSLPLEPAAAPRAEELPAEIKG